MFFCCCFFAVVVFALNTIVVHLGLYWTHRHMKLYIISKPIYAVTSKFQSNPQVCHCAHADLIYFLLMDKQRYNLIF